MAMHGYRPQFDACASCGADAAGETTFALELGGPVCEGCGAQGPNMSYLSPGARNALVALMGARMADVGDFGIPRDVLVDAFGVMRSFVVYHVPARLKALAMYGGEVSRTS
jgi:recombinational DNA repair protein (RecF pathway)